MPTALPVTAVTMNYSSVVLVGFGVIAAIWFVVHSRKGTRESVSWSDGMLTKPQHTKGHPPQRDCETVSMRCLL
jgi:hypothetical protein